MEKRKIEIPESLMMKMIGRTSNKYGPYVHDPMFATIRTKEQTERRQKLYSKNRNEKAYARWLNKNVKLSTQKPQRIS